MGMKKLREIVESDMKKFHAWREHTKTFVPQDRTFQSKDGKQYTIKTAKANPGSIFYKVHHKNKEIGSFYVRSNGLENISVMNAGVDEKHQRKGIGIHVYQTIENDSKHTGMKLIPQNFNSLETSDEAKAMWKKWKPDEYGNK